TNKLSPKESHRHANQRAPRGSINWHWLNKHPVEFSNNQHTPPRSASLARRIRGNFSTLPDRSLLSSPKFRTIRLAGGSRAQQARRFRRSYFGRSSGTDRHRSSSLACPPGSPPALLPYQPVPSCQVRVFRLSTFWNVSPAHANHAASGASSA